jgi:DNA helicase HerA-like ATPase
MASTLLPVARAPGAAEDLGPFLHMANRHGLVTGATGTGKTVTLRLLAERLSRAGVPVFLADVKGDLSGMARPGEGAARVMERVKALSLDGYAPQACPVTFWDVFGKQGHPVRTTVSDLGPLLFSRILGLNDVQSGVLNIVFKAADDGGLLLLDLKDLRAMVQHVGDHARELSSSYGNVSAASVGAIQRGLLTLEEQGGEKFLGEPALDLDDLLQAQDGAGMVNVLAADELIRSPRLYATFLLWLLADLYERLPEVGDPEKPRLVFFFDEAHLLFAEAPPVLLEKVEQVVRLVRSKGVGVWFVTQSPLDVPDTVLGQLGNRVQHALRAFTPRDQKAVKAAADTFRARPGLDVARAIGELAVGEALVSFLDEKGTPTPVQRALVMPPQSRLAPLTPDERAAVVKASALAGHYEQAVDRESAYEKLRTRAEAAPPPPAGRGRGPATPGEQVGDVLGAMVKSAARAAGSQIGRQVIRGIMGSLFGGRR